MLLVLSPRLEIALYMEMSLEAFRLTRRLDLKGGGEKARLMMSPDVVSHRLEGKAEKETVRDY